MITSTTDLKFHARRLRRESTNAERMLWKYLRCKNIDGAKFRRQQPLGNYIVDFVCFKKRIVVEVDGGQHAQNENRKLDLDRDKCLRGQGFKVLRFWNNEVLGNIESVL